MKYDITIGFEMTGRNSFGAKETLEASRTFRVENQTKEGAINFAKSQVELKVKSISVCEVK